MTDTTTKTTPKLGEATKGGGIAARGSPATGKTMYTTIVGWEWAWLGTVMFEELQRP